jgi:3-hydroxy-9,10-secoandrosta-1,3,5(10)-triene-9,17-dione monooxygenase reductase component
MVDGSFEPGEVLAMLPLPVAVVAAAAGGTRSCSTGTLTYVSYSPPLVATPLNVASRTYALLRASGEFSLSLLAESQADLAVRAAALSKGDKFAEQQIAVAAPPAGMLAPGVAGAAAVLWCALESAVETGRSILCVGRVIDWRGGGASPLVRLGRRYRGLGAVLEVEDEDEGEAGYPL